jgi:hypothetical protein
MGTQKILIVDDKEENLVALAATLAETGAELVKAQSGNEALRLSLRHNFALAILDVRMPEMDGYELAHYLRSEQSSRNLPIIFLTAADVDETDMFKGYGSGAVDYIVKPYDPRILLSKVGVFLQLDCQRREIEHHREQLEELVSERNAELFEANRRLQGEVAERRRVEEDLRRLNDELEQRVRARTAQLEATNKELESFAYSVSHDLRAPLRGIDGFSAALAEDFGEVLGAEGRGWIDRIQAAGARMSQLIDDLLQLSRLTRSDLSLEQVDLGAVARDVVRELQEQEPERSVEVEIAPRLSAVADPTLIRAVLDNLIRNAWKFTGKREHARIEVGAREDSGTWVYYVKDNGAGFSMRNADKLFGAFQRLHRQEDFPGTGIGLATVQRIVHRHGGRVWATSAPEQGTAFYFTLGA